MGKGEIRCDLGDFESTGDAAACDAASAEGCGGSASRALASASISGCGVGLRPIFATPAVSVERSGLDEMEACSSSGALVWLALLGGLLAEPATRGGLALWPWGPWPLDRRRRATVRLRSAHSAAARREQEQEASGDAMHRREADLAGDAVPQLCRECWKSTMEMAKGQAGGGRRDERWTAACRSQHRLGEPVSQAVEKGEGRTCID